ncbi:MAG: TIGR02647 family protein [Methylovulum sp.]|jgi:uncharacterized protein (TIGR02647 family)|nr:TIGR02647 family protein [Methylovulum sp.]
MFYTQDILEELNVLVRYNLDTTLEGIKVHASVADVDVVSATRRLFEKGLITQVDGGYLTTMGHEAAEHAHAVLHLLQPA